MIAGFKAIIKSKEMRNQMIATCLFMCGMMAFTGFYESVMTMGGMTTEAVTNALFFYPISWALLLFISGFISDKWAESLQWSCLVLLRWYVRLALLSVPETA